MTYYQPVFAALLIYAIVSLLRVRQHVSRLALVAALLLLLYCWPPVAWLVLWPLEMPYADHPPEQRNTEAIVVLAADVFPPSPPRLTASVGPSTYERCLYAAWLYNNWMHLPVLASGGGTGRTEPYASAMRDVLVRNGVPQEMIWTETKSRSTYENALYSAELLRNKGIRHIVLVTEAFHMKRAELCFRKLGVSLTPAACGFRTRQAPTPEFVIPGWASVASNEMVMHEVVGIVWYKLRGRI
jgi:uncharacterized SAM-binding protein YcdF (DUF218 family)